MDQHQLSIAPNGDQTVTHPDGDREGCDFEAYVERDWTGALQGDWTFTWHADGDGQPEGYWNGLRLP